MWGRLWVTVKQRRVKMARKRGTQFESVMPLLLKGRYKTQVHGVIKLRKMARRPGGIFPLRGFLKRTMITIEQSAYRHFVFPTHESLTTV